MELEKLRTWKNRVSIACAILCALFIMTVVDGSAAHLLRPFNGYRLPAGQSVELTGPMPAEATHANDIDFEADSSLISFSFAEVISGFWMGSRMWRGKVDLDPNIAPGEYSVSVFGKADRKKIGANTFRLFVYKDREAYLAASDSVIMRRSGVSPWLAAGFLLLLTVFSCVCLYLISGHKEHLMALRGEAEVFHVGKDETGVSIYFGMGRNSGIEKGSEMVLLDPEGRPLAQIRVKSVSDTDAEARLDPPIAVRPGFIVRKKTLPAG